MGYTLDLPPIAPQTTPTVVVEAKVPALPVVAPAREVAVQAAPNPPRLPLAIRADNALKPIWAMGPIPLVAAGVIPIGVCAVGALVALAVGAEAMPWLQVMSLASPLCTVGVPGGMILIRSRADAQRRLRGD